MQAAPTDQLASPTHRTSTAGRFLLAVAAAASVLIIINAASSGSILPWARAPLLMPVLIVYVLVERTHPWRAAITWLLAAQVLSWGGDIALALPVDALFIVGVGLFLLAQVSYIVTFTRFKGPHAVRRRPWLLIPYVAYFLAMMAVVLPSAGGLAPALVVYGGLLLSMAATAMDAWPRLPVRFAKELVVGSVLFVISDSLIALTKFGPVPNNAPVQVILIGTYCVAQILLAHALIGSARTPAPAAASPGAAA